MGAKAAAPACCQLYDHRNHPLHRIDPTRPNGASYTTRWNRSFFALGPSWTAVPKLKPRKLVRPSTARGERVLGSPKTGDSKMVFGRDAITLRYSSSVRRRDPPMDAAPCSARGIPSARAPQDARSPATSADPGVPPGGEPHPGSGRSPSVSARILAFRPSFPLGSGDSLRMNSLGSEGEATQARVNGSPSCGRGSIPRPRCRAWGRATGCPVPSAAPGWCARRATCGSPSGRPRTRTTTRGCGSWRGSR